MQQAVDRAPGDAEDHRQHEAGVAQRGEDLDALQAEAEARVGGRRAAQAAAERAPAPARR
jgi:hypothetical protein